MTYHLLAILNLTGLTAKFPEKGSAQNIYLSQKRKQLFKLFSPFPEKGHCKSARAKKGKNPRSITREATIHCSLFIIHYI
jgi:hypothetical protein